MNRRILVYIFGILVCGFLFSGCGNQKTITEEESGFKNLSANQMVEVMGAGWNLGNQFESVKDGMPGETYYKNPVVHKELIEAVKNAGFGSIRIPISYMGYIGDGPDYIIDEKWMSRVQEVVDQCIENGLYVIINMYADGDNSIDQSWLLCNANDQRKIKIKYGAVWRQIAERYKDYDEHLIFESMNEEFDGTYNAPNITYYNNLNDYNQIFLDTVRQTGGNNDKRWVLIPGWNTNIEYTNEAAGFVIPEEKYLSTEVPTGSKRIMISVHYYQPWGFCGGEGSVITQWGEEAKDSSRVTQYEGENFLADSFKKLNDNFTSKGYPCVVGEYGAVDKTAYDKENTFYRADFCRKVCRKCVENGCIPMYWDNGVNGKLGFALFDRTSFTVTQPEIIAAIMEEYEERGASGINSIYLNHKQVTLQVNGRDSETIQLEPTVEPADFLGELVWSSSDETIATVNSKGVVKARSAGTTVITVESSNARKASCEVIVEKEPSVNLRLYAIETMGWATLASKDSANVTKEGGEYKLTLKGDKGTLMNLGSLFIKDQAVQGNITKESIFREAKIKINSVSFNGEPCEIIPTDDVFGVNSSGVFDYCLLNQWNVGSELIKNVKTGGKNNSFHFNVGKYKEKDNTIEICFSVYDIVLE